MNNNELSIDVKKVIDTFLTPSDPFRGRGEIRLIILGQDPTLQDPAASEPAERAEDL